jgi:hypothetical protein
MMNIEPPRSKQAAHPAQRPQWVKSGNKQSSLVDAHPLTASTIEKLAGAPFTKAPGPCLHGVFSTVGSTHSVLLISLMRQPNDGNEQGERKERCYRLISR